MDVLAGIEEGTTPWVEHPENIRRMDEDPDTWRRYLAIQLRSRTVRALRQTASARWRERPSALRPISVDGGSGGWRPRGTAPDFSDALVERMDLMSALKRLPALHAQVLFLESLRYTQEEMVEILDRDGMLGLNRQKIGRALRAGRRALQDASAMSEGWEHYAIVVPIWHDYLVHGGRMERSNGWAA
jgi:DNA-directed RNA polymerase specialized sigma24 family protein